MSDAYVQVSVSMPGKPMVGYKIKVTNIYGTFNRATDSDQAFLHSIMVGLKKTFGGSVKVESIFHDRIVKLETPKEVLPIPSVDVKRKVGRPRKTA